MLPGFDAKPLKRETRRLVERAGLDSAYVGFTQAGTGAVSRTVQDKLREVYLSVKDFMTPTQKADVEAGTLAVDLAGPLQACIDAAAMLAAEYTGAAQEELKRARYRVVLPDGGYMIGQDIYLYEGSYIEFAPRAWVKFGGANFGFVPVNRPGQTNPNSGIERVVMIDPRIDMAGAGQAALLLQSLRESDIIRPYVWNVPSGTFSYDDGSGAGSVVYPKAGIILKGRATANGGCYYNTIHKPSVRNETADGLGQCGIWIGTTAGGASQYPNFNEIVSPYCLNMAVGIDLDNGNDNTIWRPEVSNGALTTGIGIRVGNASNAEAAKRNDIYKPYMENLATGLHLTTKSSATSIYGKGSTSGTTTEINDEGSNTRYQDNEIGSGSARFYQRKVLGVTQVQFADAQQASTDPHTLDDYEENDSSITPSLVPTVTCLGAAPSSVTYTTQGMSYTKIGNRVFFELVIGWSAMGGAPTGQMEVRGLPFTPLVAPAGVAQVYVQSGAAAGGPHVQGLFTSTGIALYRFDGTSVVTWDADTAMVIRISGHYPV